MKINIYQINHDRDDKRLMFFGLDEVQKLTGSKMVKAEIYDKIFSGDVDCPSLEGVFHKFNYDHPAGYTGRSSRLSRATTQKKAFTTAIVSASRR